MKYSVHCKRQAHGTTQGGAMLCKGKCFFWVLFLTAASTLYAAEKASIIVAADGSGNYKTIMDAVVSVPQNNTRWVTILVKNGIYKEHIFIDRNFIAIVGESREKTIIQFSINRDEWANAHSGTNNGSGVVDIGVSSSNGTSSATATDILLANMTIENTYNSTGVKTHVVRGEGGCNRVSIINCNIWCKGHDTIALWNLNSGMYYHANCSFKGSIDAVCPRGWCYTVGCDFLETASSSPLWHETASGSTQKFVIRTGRLTTAEGNSSTFRLLNMNNSSSLGTRFMLLDCMISGRATTKGNASEAYFFNCFGETGKQSWYADNLKSANGSPTQDIITAKWTFDGKWDPENTLPAVMPDASLPQPWDSAYDVPSAATLAWIPGRNATESVISFGTEKSPPFKVTVTGRTYTPGKLASGTYYWRVDAVNGSDTIKGTLWSFSVVPGVAITRKRAPTTTPHKGEYRTRIAITGNRVLRAPLTDLSGRAVSRAATTADAPGSGNMVPGMYVQEKNSR